MEEKLEYIDDFLASCEDWMHGEQGKTCTQARQYLYELKRLLNDNSKDCECRFAYLIPNGGGLMECSTCGKHI